MVNPPPVNTSFDELFDKVKLRCSQAWARWFNQLMVLLNFVIDYSQASVQTPSTGFSITIGDRTPVLQLAPTGVLATGTVVMPANPFDGMVVEILSTRTITAFTLSPNTGQTVNNAPTTLTGGVGISMYYNKGSGNWYRRY